jgi:hypothetical protein
VEIMAKDTEKDIPRINPGTKDKYKPSISTIE